MIDGNKMSFDELERAVFEAIQSRERERYMPKPASYQQAEEIPAFNKVPPEVSSIAVSPRLHDELRRQHQRLDSRIVLVNFCDGKAPNPRWFGIICKVDESLSGMQAKLLPE